MQMDEQAFTGLEAALIFIAFILVATTFSYILLGAGFFTAQKSQETVHSGIRQSSASLEISGPIYGMAHDPTTGIDRMWFIVTPTAGGSALDLRKMVVSFLQQEEPLANLSDRTGTDPRDLPACSDAGVPAGNWAVTAIYHDSNGSPSNFVLEPGEQFVLCIAPPNSLPANTMYSFYLSPLEGSTYPVNRKTPQILTGITIL